MTKRKGLGRGLGVFFETDEPKIAEISPVNERNEEAAGAAGEKAGAEAGKKDAAGKTASTAAARGAAEKKQAEKKPAEKKQAEKKPAERKAAEKKPAIKKPAVKKQDDRKDSAEKAEMMLNIAFLEPNAGQPRRYFNEDELQELADSIRKVGILQPLLVTKQGDHYEIIAGERRFRAAKLAGLKEVPVLVREYSRQQKLEIALIENVQRADLNPIEEAKAYDTLIREFGLRQEDVAEKVSKNRATITNSMRLLKLDDRVQELLTQNSLSSGHARALIPLENGDLQYQTAMKILNQGLSVRDTEKLVKTLLSPAKKKKSEDHSLDMFYQEMEENLRLVIGSKVNIRRKRGNKGKIEIEYYSSDELERISRLLQSIQE